MFEWTHGLGRALGRIAGLLPIADAQPHFLEPIFALEDEPCWALLAPERLFQPDEQAVAILQLVDGSHSVAAIIADLAQRYQASAELIAADVLTMLDDLAGKGMIRR